MPANSEKYTIAVVAGARPNFMKVAPLMRALSADPGIRPLLIHTGQHYDENMSGTFFRELGISAPDHHLEVSGGTHAYQTAEIMKRIEPVFIGEKPVALVVVGDVNSTVAGALVAAKLGISVVHAEAGLRSFDRAMPEEINRIVTDSISDLLLVTEESGAKNLLHEGKRPDQIVLVGNLMIDSLQTHLKQALESDVRARLGIGDRRYGLVTLHRPANVDNPSQLTEIVSALSVISNQLPLYWPMHPRAKARIEEAEVALPPAIQVLPPLGYYDFLCMQANAAVVLTDSGGIQEESTVLNVPCLTLRDNTERPVTVEFGTNRLAGTKRQTILQAWNDLSRFPKPGKTPPLWDGHAGQRCLEAIKAHLREHAPQLV